MFTKVYQTYFNKLLKRPKQILLIASSDITVRSSPSIFSIFIFPRFRCHEFFSSILLFHIIFFFVLFSPSPSNHPPSFRFSLFVVFFFRVAPAKKQRPTFFSIRILITERAKGNSDDDGRYKHMYMHVSLHPQR